MKRSTKRLIWGTAAVLLVLIGFGGYVYFVSTNAILTQAENFQFRRMKVAQLPDQKSYRFFFISNRGGDTSDNAAWTALLDERFTSAHGGALRFGAFDTEIEPALGLGRWLNASSWFLDEEIRILRVHALERAALVQQVREMVAKSPHRALLLLVHGYRTDFDYALRGTAFLAHILDIDAPVMVFDWPGDQGDSLSGYRRAQQVATASGAELAAVLRRIKREIRPERLWLVANSMGGQVVVDAFSQLYQEAGYGRDREIDAVVLTAPDVAHAEFNDQFKRELAALVRKTTVYVSSNDRALLVSRVINRGRRLGQSTLSKADAELIAETENLLDLTAPSDDTLELVDVTPVNRTRNFHNFSLEVPEYFDDMYLRLVNPDTPENRLRYRFRTPQDKVYSVLTRGR
jgi:esterase/lipase superfamily enzyme